jgi:hypothetical protein
MKRDKIALARQAFRGNVHALRKWRRTMACAITSLFLMAMFGIIAAGLAFRPSAEEKSSARREETPAAPSGDHVIA